MIHIIRNMTGVGYMKRSCDDFQEIMSNASDPGLTGQLSNKLSEHLAICEECQMINQQWMMIRQEIRAIAEESIMEHTNENHPPHPTSKMASKVMEQIYRQDDWRRPVVERQFSFSNKMHRTISIGVAFFVSVFLIGFLYALIVPPVMPVDEPLIGIQPIAIAGGITDDEFFSTTAMANITVPMKLSPDASVVAINYLLVISMIGLVTVMLLLNWFSRSKS